MSTGRHRRSTARRGVRTGVLAAALAVSGVTAALALAGSARKPPTLPVPPPTPATGGGSTRGTVAGRRRDRSGCRRPNINNAVNAPTSSEAVQNSPEALGIGTLETARGSAHVADRETGIVLTGEMDIMV